MIGRPLSILSLAFFCATALGQGAPSTQPLSFDDLHQQSVAKNPADVKFEIVPEAGRFKFHVGETILLSLRFSCDDPDKYRYWHLTDRTLAGRLAQNVFHLDHADGTADPFAGYVLSRGFGYQGGGPYQPFSRPSSLELNDWVRFDKPGKYRLYLDTVRLTVGLPRGMVPPSIGTTSNILELEILPSDQKWIDAQQESATNILVLTRTAPGVRDGRDAVLQRTDAIRTLKNLQTEEAARALLDRMIVPNTDNSVTRMVALALYASRHRSIVIDGLRQICAHPETAPPEAMDLLQRLSATPQDLPTENFATIGARRVCSTQG